MSAATLRVLCVGDIVGERAVALACAAVPQLRASLGVDFCIANGENMHQGKGLNEHLCRKLLRSGVDVLTGGDHSFDKHLIFPYMAKERRLLRPMNYPKGAPGWGYGVYELQALGLKLGVLNLRGQVFFQNPIQCPFRTADWALAELSKETPLIFVDMHAEATAEKISMGLYLDGRVSVVAGTHTHVQTADERILPQGTGFITDVGCTGPLHSVIGMHPETALQRFLLQIPQKYELAQGAHQLCGIHTEISTATGRCLSLQRICLREGQAQS
ncbi:MAG: TIGR00282 family metallophosphoesterase [Bacteroidia bacterium]|nr:TIGR00282 family metallophosphoesterase [Bacteroidia bacterium]